MRAVLFENYEKPSQMCNASVHYTLVHTSDFRVDITTTQFN